jgi:hypothetical protein
LRLKRPPRIKVLEALGSIADGRIRKEGEKYRVRSSEGDREYEVWVKGDLAYSDDNGTKFRHYVGYPIIAVLMMEGRLPFDERIARSLKGVPWRKLNEELKNYSAVEDLVIQEAERRGVKREEIDLFVEKVLNELGRLKLNEPT